MESPRYTFTEKYECDRRFVDSDNIVLHCHHYLVLLSQLAEDIGILDGKKMMAEVSEDTFYAILDRQCSTKKTKKLEDRVALCTDYFAFIGLGQLEFCFLGHVSGQVRMHFSAIDQGWLLKWGSRVHGINFIGQGFIAASYAIIMGQPCRSYSVQERIALVAGQKYSLFNIVKR